GPQGRRTRRRGRRQVALLRGPDHRADGGGVAALGADDQPALGLRPRLALSAARTIRHGKFVSFSFCVAQFVGGRRIGGASRSEAASRDQPPMSVKVIFDHAAELPAAKRRAYLDEACANDPAAREKVEALLKAHDEAGSFLQHPVVGPNDTVDSQPGQDRVDGPREAAGSRIGPYQLLEQIGEGGMGVVFLAEQTQPLRRKVALTLLKPAP